MSHKAATKINVLSLALILGTFSISLTDGHANTHDTALADQINRQIQIAQQIEIEPDGRQLC